MSPSTKKKLCVTCKSEISGHYCSNCGEKVIDEKDYSIKTFLHNTLHAFTNIDNTAFRSFYYLIKRPGFLTKEYLTGRRKPYLKPVQIFLIANLIYFIVQPLTKFNGFNTPLHTQMHRLPYSRIASVMVENKLEKSNVSYDDYERIYNTRSTTYAKSLIFLMIPMVALILKLLFIKSNRCFVEHLIFSIHMFSFYILYIFVLLFMILHFVIVWLYKLIPDPGSYNGVIEGLSILIVIITLFIYLYHAMNCFYGGRKITNALKSIVIPVGILFLIQVYRFILFFITFYTT